MTHEFMKPETQNQNAPPASLHPVVGRIVKFKCVACGLKGEVEDPKPMESVICPDCNARYLHHPDGKWFCVVRPVFAPNGPDQGRRASDSKTL